MADAIAKGQSVVVVHGVDHNHDGKYDGAKKSDLDPSLPTEATDPAICGSLLAAPSGGAATGAGGASSPTNTGLLALGGGLCSSPPARAPGRRVAPAPGADEPARPARWPSRSLLAAAATVVLVLVAGVVITLGLRHQGPPQPAGCGCGAAPLPRPRPPTPGPTRSGTGAGRRTATPRTAAATRRAGRRSTSARSCAARRRCALDIPSIGVHTSTFVDLGRAADGSIEVPTDFAAGCSTPPAPPRASSARR